MRGMRKFPTNSLDALVTDPPYGIALMELDWDKQFPDDYKLRNLTMGTDDKLLESYFKFSYAWGREAFRILKPGAFILVFSAVLTIDALSMAFRQIGFEKRDTLVWQFTCITDDTEILTNNGWKTIDTINRLDKVASYDRLTEIIEFEIPEKIVKYDYSGELINIKNQHTDQLLTPNHRVLLKKQQHSGSSHYFDLHWDFEYAMDLQKILKTKRSFKIPLAGRLDTIELKNKLENPIFYELLGWILSDGHFVKRKDYNATSIIIYQSSNKPNHVKRIRQVLNELGVGFSENNRTRIYKNKEYKEYNFTISGDIAKKIRSIIPDKKPTWKLLEAHPADLIGLFYGLIRGDGSIQSTKMSGAFYQKDKSTRDWFQGLCTLLNIRTSQNNKKDMVNFAMYDSTEITINSNPIKVITKENIRIWCPKTKNETFIARRNDKVFVTGNTGFPRGRDMGMVIDEDLDMVDQREAIKLNPNWRSNKLKGAAGFDRLLEANQPRDRPKTEKYYVTAPASEEAKLWDGWFTRLRPSYEPIAMFMKPREGTFLDNLRKWGVGALNIDANRIPFDVDKNYDTIIKSKVPYNPGKRTGRVGDMSPFAGDHIKTKKWDSTNKRKPDYYSSDKGRFPTTSIRTEPLGDGYDPVFLIPKPTIEEKGGKWNDHPSVKPLALMEHLVKLVAPDGALVLDPFVGSGTTALACEIHNINWVGFDLSKEYLQIAMQRMKLLRNRPDLRKLLE